MEELPAGDIFARFKGQAATIAQHLDQRLLAATDGTFSERQRAEFLTWARQHLLAPLIDTRQPAFQVSPGDRDWDENWGDDWDDEWNDE